MAPEKTLTITNGAGTSPLKIYLKVDGYFTENHNGEITKAVANETVDIPFRGKLLVVKPLEGEGSAQIDGQAISFADLVGYDTRGANPTPPSVHDPPASAPNHSSIDPIAKDEALGGGLFNEIPKGKQDAERGFVSRYATTIKPIHLPADENDGGAIQDRINQLPTNINHEVTVDLTDGTHGGNGSAIHTPKFTILGEGSLYIQSKSGDRSRCISISGVNSACSPAGKGTHYRLNNIGFQNLSQFAGPVRAQGCKFEGFEDTGPNTDHTAAISGKNGMVFAKQCVIGTPNDDYGISSVMMEHYALYGTTLDGKKAAVNQPASSSVEIGWGCKLAADVFAIQHPRMVQGYYRGGRLVG